MNERVVRSQCFGPLLFSRFFVSLITSTHCVCFLLEQVNDVIVGLNGSPVLATTTLSGFAAKLKKLKGPPCLSVWRPSHAPATAPVAAPTASSDVSSDATSVSATSPLVDKVDNRVEKQDAVDQAADVSPPAAVTGPAASAMAAVEALIETEDLDGVTPEGLAIGISEGTAEGMLDGIDDGKIRGADEAADNDGTAEAIAALVGMGFTPAQAAENLSAAGGDFNRALEACILATQSPPAAPQPTGHASTSAPSSLSPPPNFALEPAASTERAGSGISLPETTTPAAAFGMSQDPAPAGGLVRAASAFAFESGGGGVTFTVSLDAPLGLTLSTNLAVTHAAAGSAAFLSGCGVGCVVVAVGGAAVNNPIGLRRALDAAAAAGRNAVEITFARDAVDLGTARDSIAAILNTSAASAAGAAPEPTLKTVSFPAAANSAASMSNGHGGERAGSKDGYIKPRRLVAENLRRHSKKNPVLASSYGVKV